MSKYTIVEAPIKRSKAIKEKQAKAGVSDSVIVYRKLTLTNELKCVQEYQTAINKAIEALASALIKAKFDKVIGEDQFSTMIEKAKEEKANPFSSACQSNAHKQNLIDSKKVPAPLWELDGVAQVSSKIDLSADLELS